VKHPVGQTRNGAHVYVYLIGTQAGRHIAQQPQLFALAKEMLEQTTVRGTEVSIERDMKRLIGYSFIVATSDTDTILYGRLLRDDVYTRFVKNGKPLSTNYLTVTLKQDSDRNYELSDIWIGRFSPPRPGSANESAESKPFWSNHAFVLDSQPMHLQTVTKTCPY
jgi:hypothetical protein